MTSIRNKVYIKNQAGNFVLKDISDLTVKLTEIVEGPTHPNVLNTVKYFSDVTTQSLLDLTRDLVANDYAINNEKNAVNELINEGVLNIIGWKFEFNNEIIQVDDILNPGTTIDKNKISIGRGYLKINEEEIKNVFSINGTTEFEIENITPSSYDWYRRDLIVFVYHDSRTTRLHGAPYIDYIYGSETIVQKPPYSIDDKYYDSTYGYYPLYEILYKNINGKTYIVGSYEYYIALGHTEAEANNLKNPIINKIFEIAGFKATINLVNADLFDVTIKTWNQIESQYEEDLVLGLYSIKDEKNVFCSDEEGSLLDTKVGHSSIQEVFEGTSFIVAETNIYPVLQEPDVGLRETIENGDLLNFPFTLNIDKNQYYPIDNLLVKEINIAIKNSFYEEEWPEEGLDLAIQTAKYYVNEHNNGILTISSVVKGSQLTTITFNNKITIENFKKMTYDNKTFVNIPSDVSPGTNGDFIFVIDGNGKYQCAKIKTVLNTSQIVISNLPVDLVANNSKLLMFNKNTLTTIGNEVGSSSSKVKRAAYPHSTLEGISSIPWNETVSFLVTNEIQYSSAYDYINDKITTDCEIKNISDVVSIYAIDDPTTNYAGTINRIEKNIIIFNGLLPKNIDSSRKQFYVTYNVVSSSLRDRFTATPDEYNRLYFDNISKPGYVVVNFPFNVEVNYQQWYFIRISLFDRDVAYSSYGIRPKVLVGDPSKINATNGFYKIKCESYPGLYPLYNSTNGTPIFEIRDAYGELQTESHERGMWDDINLVYTKPVRYILKARNLTNEFSDMRIPPHRASGSNVAIAYCDIANGLISFNPGDVGLGLDSEIPTVFTITCYFNNVFDGGVDWADIQNIPEEIFLKTIRVKDNVFQITKQAIPVDKMLLHLEYVSGTPEYDSVAINPNSYLKLSNLVVENIFTENITVSGISQGETQADLVRTTTLRTNVIAPRLETSSGPILFKAKDPVTSVEEIGATFEISDTVNPPANTPIVRGKFMAGRLYNSVWNDIAECMPSDGSGKEGDLMMIDKKCKYFRLTIFDGNKDNLDAIVGVLSTNPGYVVGWNDSYENPICIALKGMVPLNISKFNKNDDYFDIGDVIFYSFRHNGFITKRYIRMYGVPSYDVKEIGIILEKNKNILKIFV